MMPERPDDELKLLARAFDRAWKRYYRPSRIGAISESVARPALAKHLIALAKEDLVSFDALADAFPASYLDYACGPALGASADRGC